jgi:hypothetical protein
MIRETRVTDEMSCNIAYIKGHQVDVPHPSASNAWFLHAGSHIGLSMNSALQSRALSHRGVSGPHRAPFRSMTLSMPLHGATYTVQFIS